MDDKTSKSVDEKYAEWGWRWEFPRTKNGKKLATLICLFSADRIAKNKQKIDDDILKQVDNRFRYLTTCFLVEKGIPFHKLNLIGFEEKRASKYGLKKHWRKSINLNNPWYKLCGLTGGGLLVLVGLLLYWITSLIGIIGFVQYQFGFTSNGFYTFLFDPFTVNVLFFQIIICFVLNFIVYITFGKLESEAWILSLWGPSFFIFGTLEQFTSNLFMWTISAYSFSAVTLFVPFHNILFNIAYSLYFLIITQWRIDANNLNFAFIDIKNFEKIHEFLHKTETMSVKSFGIQYKFFSWRARFERVCRDIRG